MKNIKVLDCTLRDGGYYNNWDFDDDLVTNYLKKLSQSGITHIELGMRNFKKPGFLGPYAYSTERFLSTLSLPSGVNYGVMVDASAFKPFTSGVDHAVSQLFTSQKKSVIKFVRIASHFTEINLAIDIACSVKKLGYFVCLNLMQSGGKEEPILQAAARQISACHHVDVIYFADSLGNMDQSEVERVYKAIRSQWAGPIGIHTHNNMSLGLQNSTAAMAFGVTWLDATVTGMGRGAGNTPTELLLTEIQHQRAVIAEPVYDLVIRYFEPLQKQFGWGPNLLYYLGAKNNVHPTYIQNLLSNPEYGTDERIGAIQFLSKLHDTSSYNPKVLEQALWSANSAPVSGDKKHTNAFKNKEVLLLANGPSIRRYKTGILQYIQTHNPVVIALNQDILASIDSSLIDFICLTHNSKYLSEGLSIQQLDLSVILPSHRFTDEELENLSGAKIVNYGMKIEAGKLVPNKTYATVPYDMTLAYIFCFLQEANPEHIYMVGFDGYESDDIRQKKNVEIFRLLEDDFHKKLTALTPTSYPINQGSVFSIL